MVDPTEFTFHLSYGLAIGVAGGTIGGLLAGIAGLGGGLIYLPLFIATLPHLSEQGVGVAVIASLGGVFLTGLFSSRAHWKLGHVEKSSLLRLAPGLMLGATLGLMLTLKLPGHWILFGMALLDLWIVRDLSRTHGEKSEGESQLPWSQAPLSLPIGFLSGGLGIGGGTMLVPLLRRSLSLRQAVGTAAACGFLMSGAAVVVNLFAVDGWGDALEGNLAFTISAWLGILTAIPLASYWAAELHKKHTEASMRRLMQLLFALLGVTLLLMGLNRL